MPDHNLTIQQPIMPVSVHFESDEELAWRAIHEDEAFGELVHRYCLPVYRYHIARTGNDQEAQDLTSQTFLAAFERITSYRFGGRFVSWFFRLADHIQGNHFHKWGDDHPQEPRFDNPGNGFTLERGANLQMELKEIARAIDALTDDAAEALTLRFFAGLNISEIGQVMIKSDAAVKMLIYRGLRDLKVLLFRSPRMKMVDRELYEAEELDAYVEAHQAGQPTELPPDLPLVEWRLADKLLEISAIARPDVHFWLI